MEIIIKPVVTEKMTATTDKLNQFGFVVNKKANKVQIKEAVEKLYGVNVTAVNTMRYAGKSKSKYTKTGLLKGRTDSYKKAVVSLRNGETIDLYSNI
jgi:large subunit ribosomal protein L23